MSHKAERNPLQTVLLFIVALGFGFGTLVQIADQSQQHDQQSLTIQYKSLKTADDIVQLSNPTRAIAYTSVVSLAKLPVADKKQRFIALLLPAILISKQKHQQQRQKLDKILATDHPTNLEQTWLNRQMALYDVETPAQLKQRMINLPNSLILAQAALETGWGSSRFFVKANNVFGIWSFDPDEKRMMASQQREGKKIYVKRYDSLLGAIDDYFLTLGRGSAYKELRQAARKTQNSQQLIRHLHRYSELGEDYIQRLDSLIRHNNLKQYDNYHLQNKA
ncbi:glucosaminidase domain-containing protein [Amphritea sp. 2_MG-2023]|uniref:glucosaminidase domain-containing protein n=1 Tax=Amphritea TaxID=515417 RepID=UPI001C06596C|nr:MULTISPECIES: glucosaminidase domain-containing protein [Amphritea]MBU2967591.1 glucosaminidase domain-containing protein [Amphritea atlantica]MDO6419079.1 glucosaminidase domain-containing protein [Amphritea sp. 2_MG-2023]